MQVEKFGRLQLDFDPSLGVDSVVYVAPDGTEETGPVFTDLPVTFRYDKHGFETAEPVGRPRTAARFTPCAPGGYSYRAMAGGRVAATGAFDCVDGARHGYVGVSAQDRRYFACTDGACYVPIGLNMVGVTYHPLPKGMEHFEHSDQRVTCGMGTWSRWIGELSANGGNYARVWLSQPYTEARTEVPGRLDQLAFQRLDAMVEEARAHGVRLKLCLDHFRHFDRPGHFAHKVLRDPATGKSPESVQAWLESPYWNDLWFRDVQSYLARYWNDPVVFAWELWNEMNTLSADFSAVCDWTQRMLRRVKAASPKNLVVNSLGSTDDGFMLDYHKRFQAMELMEFDQIHRYLDQGAPLAICNTDPVALSIGAVHVGSGKRPVILTETGAVDDRHIGPFRYYDCDHDGLIFTDCTYPAFFAGAAGSGHIWHWNEYVERKNLWKYFKPLAELLQSVECDKEAFEAVEQSTARAWVLGLRGKTCALYFVRSRADRWDHVLRDKKSPAPVADLSFDSGGAREMKAWGLCGESISAHLKDGRVCLDDFVHGCILKLGY